MALSVLWDVVTELHARYAWPSAEGRIISAGVKDSYGPGTSRRDTRYWVEYQVEFAVPDGQCKTGGVATVPGQSSQVLCRGTVRTRSTRSSSTAFHWMSFTYTDLRVRVLYDPNGPGVRIAGDSVWLVYPWPNIFLVLGWLALFFTLENFTARRLRYLETLPPDYDATPPAPPTEPRSWDLIDLNPPKR
jgi:hypothetical protein